jgi:hypothetical protein
MLRHQIPHRVVLPYIPMVPPPHGHLLGNTLLWRLQMPWDDLRLAPLRQTSSWVPPRDLCMGVPIHRPDSRSHQRLQHLNRTLGG